MAMDITATLVIFGFAITSFVVYRRWLHPLSKFPGPFVASVTSLYRTYWNFQPNFQENFVRLHEKYGPIVRYSPNGVIFSDPELLALAYGRRADKSDFFAPNFDTHSTFTRKKYEDHVVSKKVIATAYTHTNVQLFESRMDQLLLRWLGLLQKSTEKHGRTDFFQYISWFTTDVTSQLVSGKPIGFIEAEADVRNLLHHKSLCFRWINFLAIQEDFSWWIRNTRLGRYAMMARPTDKSGIGVVMKERDRIVDSVIDATGHIDSEALVEGSLLKSFINAHLNASNNITMTDVRAEILFALDARIKENLSQELLSAEKRHQIPSIQGIVSAEQAKQLPYLHACVQEVLRFAPTMSQLPRLSPRDTGTHLYGKYVPPGYSVSTSPWIIGRNKELYGEDADTFRPERWLEASELQLRKFDRNSFHFGYGGRKCVAKNFALLQIYKVVAELFRRFDVYIDGSTQCTSAGKASTRQFKFNLRQR